MTTVTPLRNEMSTTLSLFEYKDVSNKLISFDEMETLAGVTHVAVLNHSVKSHRGGALCLLLSREKSMEVFHHVECSPVLLASHAKFASKLQR